MLVDRLIEVTAGDLGQVLAMLTDFVPEAIAFGALFATGSSGPRFAVLIAMQNLPEADTSFHDLVEAGIDDGKTLALHAPLALPGPAAALGGFFVLSDAPLVIGTLTLLSAGGILYLVFQRIVADERLEPAASPTTGSSSGRQGLHALQLVEALRVVRPAPRFVPTSLSRPLDNLQP
jgi:ZIP family zinc transporter